MKEGWKEGNHRYKVIISQAGYLPGTVGMGGSFEVVRGIFRPPKPGGGQLFPLGKRAKYVGVG